MSARKACLTCGKAELGLAIGENEAGGAVVLEGCRKCGCFVVLCLSASNAAAILANRDPAQVAEAA